MYSNKKTIIEKLANYESKLRPTLIKMPSSLVTMLYSKARKNFMSAFVKAKLNERHIPTSTKVKLWDIDFNCGLINAAGMFKNGEGYYTCAKMGAGAFLAGTTTLQPRKGNRSLFCNHPFASYVNAHSASNWMGLPNIGHLAVANTISKIEKIRNCPIGISIASNPELDDNEKVKGVLEGFKIFEKVANVDFIELNSSCPNVTVDKIVDNTSEDLECNKLDTNIIDKLTFFSKNFLKKRTRHLPVVVKYSNDIQTEILPQLIDLLIDLDFDGIVLGNTSTDYDRYAIYFTGYDRILFNYFIKKYGGGLSGEILKDRSLFLSKFATSYIQKKNLSKEFHCIRVGGISLYEDIVASNKAGVLLNQWFTGFWEKFAQNGFDTYKRIFSRVIDNL